VVESLKPVLRDRHHVTERTRPDDVVAEASAGSLDAVVLCINSLSPPVHSSGGVFESAVRTIRAIKVARAVPIVVLSTMPEWHDPIHLVPGWTCSCGCR
jgi:hypothetical protein